MIQSFIRFFLYHLSRVRWRERIPLIPNVHNFFQKLFSRTFQIQKFFVRQRSERKFFIHGFFDDCRLFNTMRFWYLIRYKWSSRLRLRNVRWLSTLRVKFRTGFWMVLAAIAIFDACFITITTSSLFIARLLEKRWKSKYLFKYSNWKHISYISIQRRL